MFTDSQRVPEIDSKKTSKKYLTGGLLALTILGLSVFGGQQMGLFKGAVIDLNLEDSPLIGYIETIVQPQICPTNDLNTAAISVYSSKDTTPRIDDFITDNCINHLSSIMQNFVNIIENPKILINVTNSAGTLVAKQTYSLASVTSKDAVVIFNWDGTCASFNAAGIEVAESRKRCVDGDYTYIAKITGTLGTDSGFNKKITETIKVANFDFAPKLNETILNKTNYREFFKLVEKQTYILNSPLKIIYNTDPYIGTITNTIPMINKKIKLAYQVVQYKAETPMNPPATIVVSDEVDVETTSEDNTIKLKWDKKCDSISAGTKVYCSIGTLKPGYKYYLILSLLNDYNETFDFIKNLPTGTDGTESLKKQLGIIFGSLTSKRNLQSNNFLVVYVPLEYESSKLGSVNVGTETSTLTGTIGTTNYNSLTPLTLTNNTYRGPVELVKSDSTCKIDGKIDNSQLKFTSLIPETCITTAATNFILRVNTTTVPERILAPNPITTPLSVYFNTAENIILYEFEKQVIKLNKTATTLSAGMLSVENTTKLDSAIDQLIIHGVIITNLRANILAASDIVTIRSQIGTLKNSITTTRLLLESITNPPVVTPATFTVTLTTNPALGSTKTKFEAGIEEVTLIATTNEPANCKWANANSTDLYTTTAAQTMVAQTTPATTLINTVHKTTIKDLSTRSETLFVQCQSIAAPAKLSNVASFQFQVEATNLFDLKVDDESNLGSKVEFEVDYKDYDFPLAFIQITDGPNNYKKTITLTCDEGTDNEAVQEICEDLGSDTESIKGPVTETYTWDTTTLDSNRVAPKAGTYEYKVYAQTEEGLTETVTGEIELKASRNSTSGSIRGSAGFQPNNSCEEYFIDMNPTDKNCLEAAFLQEQGILTGQTTPKGQVANLKAKLLRIEYFTISARLLGNGNSTAVDKRFLEQFTDLSSYVINNKENNWWLAPVSSLKEVIRGKGEDGGRRLDPYGQATQAEVGKIAAETLIPGFKNNDYQDPWFKDTLDVYAEYKIRLNPLSIATRSDAVSILYYSILINQGALD